MKILQVTPIFVPAKSNGLKVMSHHIAQALAKRGHEVTVYTTDVDAGCSRLRNIQGLEKIDGMKVRYFKNVSNLLAYKYRGYLPVKMFRTVSKEISSFDIIHLHDFRHVLNVIVHHYAQKHAIPYVLDAHGSTPRIGRRVKRGLQRLFDLAFGYRLLRDASRVIALTEVMVNEYKEVGVEQGKIILLAPLPSDPEEFSQLPPSGNFRHKFGIKEKHILMFFGRIHWVKGLDFLVESFHELAQHRSDVILAIVGPDDGYKSTLEGLIERLHISDKVLFTGFLGGEEKLSALVDANVVFQISRYEAGPGASFEAILCNTPIIVSKHTGAGEIVRKTDTGYLVEYGNKDELVDTVQKILDNPAEAMTKTQKAKDYIKTSLSTAKGIKNYENLYQEVVESCKK